MNSVENTNINLIRINRIDSQEFLFNESILGICRDKWNGFQLLILVSLFIGIFTENFWFLFCAGILEVLIYMGNIISSSQNAKAMNSLITTSKQMYKRLLINNIVILTRNTNDGTNTKIMDFELLYKSTIEELEKIENDLLQNR